VARKLVIFRHGPAGDAGEFQRQTGLADSQRPLTQEGVEEVQMVARHLRRLVRSVDAIVSSPYRRAQETADILAARYPRAKRQQTATLEPINSPEKTLRYLQTSAPNGTLLLVGHEPHLTRLLGYLLAGEAQIFFQLKKAGFAVLDFKDELDKNSARLKCFLQPNQLRKILNK
jgi:phosphohistidine phosphatase